MLSDDNPHTPNRLLSFSAGHFARGHVLMARWPAADRLLEGRWHRAFARQLRAQQGLGLRGFADPAGELFSDIVRGCCVVSLVCEVLWSCQMGPVGNLLESARQTRACAFPSVEFMFRDNWLCDSGLTRIFCAGVSAVGGFG